MIANRSAVAELQADVLAILNTCPDLLGVTVRAEGKGTTREIIDKALDTIAPAVGKKGGVVIVVRMPEWKLTEPNSPAPVVEITQLVTVIENPMINEGVTGAGIAAAQLVEIVMQRLHHRSLSLGTIIARGAEPANAEETLRLGYDVEFRFPVRSIASEARAHTPNINISGTTVTLSGASTPGERIFYTRDGKTPVPGNSQIYSAPFAAPSGTRIRASTIATGRELSEFAEKTV